MKLGFKLCTGLSENSNAEIELIEDKQLKITLEDLVFTVEIEIKYYSEYMLSNLMNELLYIFDCNFTKEDLLNKNKVYDLINLYLEDLKLCKRKIKYRILNEE